MRPPATYPDNKEGTAIALAKPLAIAAYCLALLLLLASFVFSVFYLCSGHDTLTQWYLSLGGCFYNSDHWTTRFFTPTVKTAGNALATVGAVVSAIGIVYTGIRWKRSGSLPASKIYLDRSGIGWHVALVLIGTAVAWKGWRMLPPSYDEIFSAVNGSGMHPFRTLSYYMLPNNHILFNVVNGILFGWKQHLIGTGRALSLLAYITLSICCFRWLCTLMNSRLFAFIATLCVMLQFATWSMAAQARGYECQLLCGWVAFLSLYHMVQRPNGGHLRLNALANLVGYALIPSWSYFYMAQLLFLAPYLLWNRHLAARYTRYQVATLAGVYLFYLPALCFSGRAALTGNKYVRPSDLHTFLPQFTSLSKNFISYCFSGLAAEGSTLSYMLFLAPLLLFLSKRNTDRIIAGLYAATWLGYLLVSLLVRHMPFHRTLIVQFGISMAVLVYTFYAMVSLLSAYIGHRQTSTMVRTVLYMAPLALLLVYEVRYDRQNANLGVYGNDVNGIYDGIKRDIGLIPPGSSIAFSEESFYCYYYCRWAGYNAHRCATGDETYYIKRNDDALPESIAANYTLLLNMYDEHMLYKRK